MKSQNRHDSVNDKQRADIDINSMIRRDLQDIDFNSMIRRNLCDFVNDMESSNGMLVVPRDVNSDNAGDEETGLVPDLYGDHDIPWVDMNPDEFTQTWQNFPDVCQQDSFANNEIICDNVHNDMTSTK